MERFSESQFNPFMEFNWGVDLIFALGQTSVSLCYSKHFSILFLLVEENKTAASFEPVKFEISRYTFSFHYF